MTELEKAAREYADGLRSVDNKNTYDNVEVDSSRMVAFKRGAEWQAKQSPWISVEEQLPPDLHKNVLLKVENCGVLIGLGLNIKENDLKITHWMPIPE